MAVVDGFCEVEVKLPGPVHAYVGAVPLPPELLEARAIAVPLHNVTGAAGVDEAVAEKPVLSERLR